RVVGTYLPKAGVRGALYCSQGRYVDDPLPQAPSRCGPTICARIAEKLRLINAAQVRDCALLGLMRALALRRSGLFWTRLAGARHGLLRHGLGRYCRLLAEVSFSRSKAAGLRRFQIAQSPPD